MIRERDDIQFANRIVIKAGTSIVTTPEGFPSLTRMASIVENAAKLVREGKEVMIVTSGSVGFGRQKLRKQALMKQSMSDLMSQKDVNPNPTALNVVPSTNFKVSYSSACAAAGQMGLMSLYETMFNQYDVATSQLLVTSFDFTSPERRKNIQYVISQLLSLGIVPIINENDAVSANQGYQTFGNSFSDNDSLSALVSIEMSAQLLIILTDVNGVYDRPPSDPNSKLIDIFTSKTGFEVGEKSLQGRGGMGAKVSAALSAVQGGVQAVVIAPGGNSAVINEIMRGDQAGTLFLQYQSNTGDADRTEISSGSSCSSGGSSGGSDDSTSSGGNKIPPGGRAEEMGRAARVGSRQLQALSTQDRERILHVLADSLSERTEEILSVNAVDIENAVRAGITGQVCFDSYTVPKHSAVIVLT